jgi:2',3'-cyclic-nucleotide 2'-phosphodiesterase
LTFRLLFVGDVVGPAGCSAVLDVVPRLREELALDAVVVNAENSAPGGRGVTEDSAYTLLAVADFLTLGNHAFDAEGHRKLLEGERRMVRPANAEEGMPGRGWGTFEAGGVMVGVTNVLGRVFIDRFPLSSPFEAADRALAELEEAGADVVLVDAHAEATSEKLALGYHLAGRAQAVLGTHTHVPTADVGVMPGGTAYASDVGATCCEDSVIGFNRKDFVGLFLGEPRGRLYAATEGPVIFRSVLVELDPAARKAVDARPVYETWYP